MGVVSVGACCGVTLADGVEEVADFVLAVIELEEEVLDWTDWVVVVVGGLALEEAVVVVVDGGNTILLEAELEGASVDRVVVIRADEEGGGGGATVVVVGIMDGADVGTVTGGVVKADVVDGSLDVLDTSNGSD